MDDSFNNGHNNIRPKVSLPITSQRPTVPIISNSSSKTYNGSGVSLPQISRTPGIRLPSSTQNNRQISRSNDQDEISRRSHPKSPRDNTNIIVNGVSLDRNKVPPIMVPPIVPSLAPPVASQVRTVSSSSVPSRAPSVPQAIPKIDIPENVSSNVSVSDGKSSSMQGVSSKDQVESPRNVPPHDVSSRDHVEISRENSPPVVPNNSPPIVPRDVSPVISSNVSPKISNNISPVISSNMSPKISNNISPVISSNMSPITTNDTSPIISNNISSEILHNSPPVIPRSVSLRASSPVRSPIKSPIVPVNNRTSNLNMRPPSPRVAIPQIPVSHSSIDFEIKDEGTPKISNKFHNGVQNNSNNISNVSYSSNSSKKEEISISRPQSTRILPASPMKRSNFSPHQNIPIRSIKSSQPHIDIRSSDSSSQSTRPSSPIRTVSSPREMKYKNVSPLIEDTKDSIENDSKRPFSVRIQRPESTRSIVSNSTSRPKSVRSPSGMRTRPSSPQKLPNLPIVRTIPVVENNSRNNLVEISNGARTSTTGDIRIPLTEEIKTPSTEERKYPHIEERKSPPIETRNSTFAEERKPIPVEQIGSPPTEERKAHPVEEKPNESQPQESGKQFVPPNVTNFTTVNRPTAIEPLVPLIPDFKNMSEVGKAACRAKFRLNFGKLREQWPSVIIPDFSDNDDLETVYATYDTYLRHVHVSYSSDQYKIYLVIYFAALEFLVVKMLGLPGSGFTISQIKSITRYERLLTELGEKQHSGGGSSWPIEVRLIVTGLINLVLFVIISFFADKLGPQVGNIVMNLVSGFFGGVVSPPPSIINVNGQQPVNIPGLPVAPSSTVNSLFSTIGNLAGGGSGFNLGGLLSGLGGGGGNSSQSSAPENKHSSTGNNTRPSYNE